MDLAHYLIFKRHSYSHSLLSFKYTIGSFQIFCYLYVVVDNYIIYLTTNVPKRKNYINAITQPVCNLQNSINFKIYDYILL